VFDSSIALPLVVALPFLAAGAVLIGGRALRLRSGWLVVAAAVASTLVLVQLARQAGDPAVFRVQWLPAIDVALAFRADGFALFFALLVAGIGVLVSVYSLGYLDPHDADRAPRYYASLAVFMGAMLGIALADDLILLFVFWELTSISSFLLIGYRREDDDAKAGALTALQVTALGGLLMSVGFLIIGQLCGTFSLSVLAADPARIAPLASPLGSAALLLVLCGAATKSAQVPFHFWLPQAMVAPTPVSAYLHAATMVKAGVFLLGRMLPIFGQSPLWFPVLVSLGTATMLLGAYQAMRETDLKAILAKTTGSTLGLLFLLYGIGAAEQDALQMLSHSLYKGALFLVAGIVEHRVHTRDLERLGGLRHELPLAYGATVLAALSMAGLPPLFGFLAKESVYAAVLDAETLTSRPVVYAVVVAASLLSSALIAATAYRFTVGVFLGAPAHRRAHDGGPHHPRRDTLWVAPVALALAALALGVLGATSLPARLAAAASSRGGAHLELSLLPHLGLPLLVSMAALALAALLYVQRLTLVSVVGRFARVPPAADLWRRSLDAVIAAGAWYSRRWENGSLRWYLAGTILAAPLLVGCVFHALGLSHRQVRVDLGQIPWYGLSFCGLLVVSTLAAVRARTRLAAAIASSSTGFLVAMLFVVYRSPDILLTQILIETVSTIFILLVLVHLPQFPPQDLSRGGRLLNAAIAGVFGLTVSVLLLLAMTPGLREADNIATRPGGLLSLSLAEGGGANAVNVIIVDIRAIDTTGEITVLVVVGLCIYGLLRARRAAA
jgi:NADH:ubiquinone oxidoreductase subunit 5 (subunit L)/multisubunit Na+/H+ antiporter MnhA subunit